MKLETWMAHITQNHANQFNTCWTNQRSVAILYEQVHVATLAPSQDSKKGSSKKLLWLILLVYHESMHLTKTNKQPSGLQDNNELF